MKSGSVLRRVIGAAALVALVGALMPMVSRAATFEATIRGSVNAIYVNATISEVRPNGDEMYITSGFLRASFRTLARSSTIYAPVPIYTAAAAKLLTPGTAATVRVPINPIAYTFRAGSKIRISISAPGGDRPSWQFDPHVTNGAVTNTVMFGKGSSLVLPTVSTVTAKDAQPACHTNRGQPCRTYIAASNGG